ncbi:alpha/beta-hydrolase [Trametes versicolor FP-101664 SS1]|uniref:alpha/beta-hydrolase n=1 Tax=Trametes versicolor (strain FP-101664) TaxID=717944 RepID=UPI00046242F7|nr:alpha/beta-hydrolase [Trametes versicolor FP-101664 SS1]EIW57897.1 alpha/beta-hydrolase [Trametes versicolor FP-101664 SS1]
MAYTTTTVRPLLPSRRVKSGLRLLAKRYVPEASNRKGFTLLFFHCAGSHKEVWEPIIDGILSGGDSASAKSEIREIWSFEMQNHGESTSWNSEALAQLDAPLNVDDWAEGLQAFVASGALDGHKLIAIGHSLGASAMILATIPDHLRAVHYEAVVMVEDALMAWDTYVATREDSDAILKEISDAVKKRRDVWNSREEAFKYFQKRIPWIVWDERVLELYAKHGLRDIQVNEGGTTVTKVTLACAKDQEGSAYLYIAPHFRVGNRLRTLDPSLPIHFIHGERNDSINPERMHESVLKLPKKVASVQKVPDAGHFVVQENPDELAAAIERVIASITGIRSHL